MMNVVQNILRVTGTETEDNKKDLWRMVLEVYGALRKCYMSDTCVAICLNLFIYELIYFTRHLGTTFIRLLREALPNT